jgi:Cu2+-exporting ATPase
VPNKLYFALPITQKGASAPFYLHVPSPCYHCGLPIPDDLDLSVKIGGEARAMCCYGCQAVAQSIVDNGLDDYYRSRDALPESPREAMPAILDQLALFDHADFQKSFVKAAG